MQPGEILRIAQRPPWTTLPDERDPRYFHVWQRVSVALQRSFREWSRERYFQNLARLADRDAAYAMLVFSACRPFYGRPRAEFTFDIADPATLAAAWRGIGHSLRVAMAPIEKRLRKSGDEPLARRYAPVWHQDVLVAVKTRPKPLIRMLALESKLIDGVIDLGTQRDEPAARRLHRVANHSLRNFHGEDMTELLPKILEEAARVLTGY